MKPAPTLIDEVYRASFRNETNPGWKSNSEVRKALESARRFVVDEPMAAFMAELANESFLKAGTDNPIVLRIADSLRLQARLPHEAIWLEYPLRAYQKRQNQLHGTVAPPSGEVPFREGWLIQQHPHIDTAHIMHLWTQDGVDDKARWDDYKLWTFPFAFGWCADDNPLPWQTTVVSTGKDGQKAGIGSGVIVGLGGYQRSNVGCVRSPLINDPVKDNLEAYVYLLQEWTGVIRRVWSLLATIDNIPTIKGEVRLTKGFLARGQIRKFLSHTTITLTVPFKQDTRVLARNLIAIAHRRRHEVRAFWREDWRHPPSKRCDPHLWDFREDADHIECGLCHGRMTYIHKHMRGDGGIGLVTHDYSVRKGETDEGPNHARSSLRVR